MNEYEMALHKRAKNGDEKSASLLEGIRQRRRNWFARPEDPSIASAVMIFNKRSDITNLIEWLPPYFQRVLSFEEGYKAGLQKAKEIAERDRIAPSTEAAKRKEIVPPKKKKWFFGLFG